MRIGIDYTAAIRQGGGIGRYARELVRALLAEEIAHEYAIMAGIAGRRRQWRTECGLLAQLANDADKVSVHGLPISDDWMARIWQRLKLPIPATLFTGKVDAFYSPDFVLPHLPKDTRSLLTIHDLSFMRYPETFPDSLRTYLEAAVPPSVARADHIFADSHNTRKDLIELLDVPEDKVSTVHLGVAGNFSPGGDPSERRMLSEKYDLRNTPYVLSLGTVQPRKNYVRLMQAMDPLADKMQIQLVIAGQPAWLSEPIMQAAAQREHVTMLRYVDDADIPALYRQAELFAFPSLYEGFGLPPLEAMACGIPVIASTASSIPEVVGDAALMVDPLDVKGWTDAMELLLTRSNEKRYYRTNGTARVNRFTWKRSAQQWLKIVERVLG